MQRFEIEGGQPLCGEVSIEGAKNAALPILAASLLATEPVELLRVPSLGDTRVMTRLLSRLGISSTIDGETMRLETVDTRPVRAGYRLLSQMRAGFCVLGPLLARRRRAIVALPGGCNLGDRPVDIHLKGLTALGAKIRLKRGYILAEAKQLRGATIDLSGPNGPTVTGTANVLSAAVLARGVTVLHGVAVEPEVVDLGNFLQSLGARISGLGTPTLRIEGVDQLNGGRYRIISDRIEAATFLLAGVITGGEVTVTNVTPSHLSAFLEVLKATGCEVAQSSESITASPPGKLEPVDIVTQPYPGFPTDLQAPMTAMLALAEGRSTITDRIFPSRFMHLAELSRMGARIDRREGTVVITGVKKLSGAKVQAPDLRAGAALTLAALVARGKTVLKGVEHLDRGYSRFDEKLAQLGGSLERHPGGVVRTGSIE